MVAATASYAGESVRRLQNGRIVDGVGLVEARRWTIAPPGTRPMRQRLFVLADAPDLALAPQVWPGLKTVWTGAGPAPQGPLRLLRLVAWLRHRNLTPPLAPFAPVFHWVINALRWGEDRGGMVVEARGLRGGQKVARTWSLIAEGEDGPSIPAMAAAVLIRQMASGRRPSPGARPATRELELADFEPLFARRRIVCGLSPA